MIIPDVTPYIEPGADSDVVVKRKARVKRVEHVAFPCIHEYCYTRRVHVLFHMLYLKL